MAVLLRGAEVVSALNEKITSEVAALVSRGVLPTLAILRVGDKPDDLAYARGAIKRAETVGVAIRQIVLPETVSQEDLLAEIEKINADDSIHGCLLLRPLPKHIDDACVRESLLPEKDVDGITDGSLAGVFTGTKRGFPPCTAQACMELLSHYGIDPAGKRAVVIGRSLVIGKPVAMMLLQKKRNRDRLPHQDAGDDRRDEAGGDPHCCGWSRGRCRCGLCLRRCGRAGCRDQL